MSKKQSDNEISATFKACGRTAGLPDHEGLIGSGLSEMSTTRPIQLGHKLRDDIFIQYPMIPNGVFTYQQIVSSREWALGGEPDAVFTALDFLNNIQSKNLETGFVEYGFESFLKRRVVDYLTIGRTAFGLGKKGAQLFMQYIDPIYLTMDRKGEKRTRSGYIRPISPRERMWVYDGRRYAAEDIIVHHPMPLGANLFVSPLSWLIPSANLAWLLRSHNTAALDGRKIRDILLVGSPSVGDSIKQALITLAKLYAGADVSEVGIPVVEINNNLAGTPVKDLFAMVGISNVPESLDQSEFLEIFANDVASTMGIAVRHIWNPPDSGNRSVEEIQATREQEKGPSAYIRSEQRLINQSGFLNSISDSDVRFGFIEESDLVALKTKAEVLKAYGEAALSFKLVFGQSLTLPSFMTWMKRIGAMPLDLELDESAAEEIAVDSDSNPIVEGSTGVAGDEPVVAMEKNLDDGQVVVNQDGYIIGKRVKLFLLPRISSMVSEKFAKNLVDQKKKMKDALVKVENYVQGEEEDSDIEQAVNYQIYVMAGEKVEELLSKEKENLTAENQIELSVIQNKVNFNLELSDKEIDFIDDLCDKHGIKTFDFVEEVEYNDR